MADDFETEKLRIAQRWHNEGDIFGFGKEPASQRYRLMEDLRGWTAEDISKYALFRAYWDIEKELGPEKAADIVEFAYRAYKSGIPKPWEDLPDAESWKDL